MATSYSSRLGTAPEEAVKAPCVVASLVNITLTGEQTINSVAVVAGDRVLVTGQTDTTENGIYVAAAGAWSRATDWNDGQDVVNGQTVIVPNAIYQASFTGDIVIGTTAVTFVVIAGNIFATVYQGAFAADIATRTDGTALVTGDLYFNTAVAQLKVWTGTTWRSGVAGDVTVQNFSGTGAQTSFTLASSPVSEVNTQVYIDGVYQQKTTYSVSASTLVFSTAPPSGTNNIEVIVIETLALGEGSAALTTYTPAGTGAVAATVQNKLRESVSVLDFGAVAYASKALALAGISSTAAFQAAIDHAETIRGSVYIPAGYYAATFIVPTGYIDIYGAGRQSTILVNNTASTKLVDIRGPQTHVHGIGFDNNNAVADTVYSENSFYTSLTDLEFKNYGNATSISWAINLQTATISNIDNISCFDNDEVYGGQLNISLSYYSVIKNFYGGRSGTSANQYSVKCDASVGTNFHGLYLEEGGGAGLALFSSCYGMSVTGFSSEIFGARNPLVADRAFVRIVGARQFSIKGGYISHQAVVGTPVALIDASSSSGVHISDMYWNREINEAVVAMFTSVTSNNITIDNITPRNKVSATGADVACLVTNINGASGATVKNIVSLSTGATVKFDDCSGIVAENCPPPVYVGTASVPSVNGLNTAVIAQAATITNVTGDGTVYAIPFPTIITDNNSDFPGGSVFTAPVTGDYQINLTVGLTGLTASHTYGQIYLVTSNRTYLLFVGNVAAMRTTTISANELAISGSVIADMDIGDTCVASVYIDSGTKVVNVTNTSRFSVMLRK